MRGRHELLLMGRAVIQKDSHVVLAVDKGLVEFLLRERGPITGYKFQGMGA